MENDYLGEGFLIGNPSILAELEFRETAVILAIVTIVICSQYTMMGNYFSTLYVFSQLGMMITDFHTLWG